MFKGKVLVVAGGTSTFRARLCDFVLRRYPDLTELIMLVGNKKDYKREENADKKSLITIKQVDFRSKKSLIKELNKGDYLLYIDDSREYGTSGNLGSHSRKKIIETQNVIEAAAAADIQKAMFVSNAEVCNPINLHGSLGLSREKLWIAGNADLNDVIVKTEFSSVRVSGMAITMYSEMDLLLKSKDKGCLIISDRLASKFWITPDEGLAFIFKCFIKMEGGEVFIPKTPSISMKNLAQIICPNCQLKETGLPPGSKLHEILIAAEESGLTLEYNDYYVIQPEYQWWKTKGYGDKSGGREAAPGFIYSSNTNSWVLSPEELEFIITRVIRRELAKNRINI